MQFQGDRRQHQRHRLARLGHGPWGGVALLCIGLGLLSCAHPQLAPPIADQHVVERPETLRQAQALLRSGQLQQALGLVEHLPPPLSPQMIVVGIRAALALKLPARAQPLQNALTAALDRNPGPGSEAQVASISLIRWLIAAHMPEPALLALLPLVRDGCPDATTCALTRRVLAQQPASSPFGPAVVVRSEPNSLPLRQVYWRELTHTLALDNRLGDARAITAAALRAHPQQAWLWLLDLGLARRDPDNQARKLWNQAVLAANLPAAVLEEIAATPEPPRDMEQDVALLAQATARPEATESMWQRYALALARAGMRQELARLATGPTRQHWQSQTSQAVLAMALLQVEDSDHALPLVRELPADSGITIALEAEITRQRGMPAEARKSVKRLAQAHVQLEEGAWILARLWQIGSMTRETEELVQLATAATGTCQLSAAQLRSERVILGRELDAATEAKVLQHAELLLAPTSPRCPFVLSQLDSQDSQRQALLRRLEERSSVWHSVHRQVLQLWLDHGVASRGMVRTLAQRQLAAGHHEAFLSLEQTARRLPDDGTGPGDDRAATEAATRSGHLLLRWLRATGVSDIDDGATAWRVTTQLLNQEHVFLARAWAERASWLQPDPPGRGLLDLLVNHGAADLALAWMQSHPPTETSELLERAQSEAAALLALDRPVQAGEVLAVVAGRVDLAPRSTRQLLDFSVERGLCEATLAMVPRYLADADAYAWRSGIKALVRCARRQQQLAPVQTWMDRWAKGSGSDGSRLEQLARDLQENGLDLQAIEAFAALEKTSVAWTEETFLARAKAQLGAGMANDAARTLRQMTTVRRRGAASLLVAADLLDQDGKLELASDFLADAARAEPDAGPVLQRLAIHQLRAGDFAQAASTVQSLFRSGITNDDADVIMNWIVRCGAQSAVLDVLTAAADPDRELERFRLSLAVRLGQRPVVEAGVRKQVSRNSSPPAQAAPWLAQVGATQQARESSADYLAAPEPVGDAEQRIEALDFALENQRDPSSAGEALGLARLYLNRAADPQQAALLGAIVLTDHGFAAEARAVLTQAGQDATPWRQCRSGLGQWDTGDQAGALLAWRQGFAMLLLEPRLRDWLHMPIGTLKRSDMGNPLAPYLCLREATLKAGHPELVRWFAEQALDLAPDSWPMHVELVSTWLVQGQLPQAVQALIHASQFLGQADQADRDELGNLAAWAWQKGGAPQLLAWWAADWQNLSTDPGLLAQARVAIANVVDPPAVDAASLAPDVTLPTNLLTYKALHDQLDATQRQGLTTLAQQVDALAPVWPELRWALAQAWANSAKTAKSIEILGQFPFAVHERRSNTVARAAADALIGQLGLEATEAAPSDEIRPKTKALDIARAWLRQGQGVDARLALAQALVRAGHPAFAQQILKEVEPVSSNDAHVDRTRVRLLVDLYSASDDQLVRRTLTYLRGRRSSLQAIDEALFLLLRSGRLTAAQQLTATLHAEEPGLRSPSIVGEQDDGSPLAIFRQAEQFQLPTAGVAERIGKHVSTDNWLTLQTASSSIAPQLSISLTEKAASEVDETWRPWLSLVHQAFLAGDLTLARTSLAKATAARAPEGVLACARLGALEPGTLASCIRGRPLHLLDSSELSDLASAIANRVDGPAEPAMAAAMQAADGQLALHRFVAAAAGRAWSWSPEQSGALGQFLRRLIGSLQASLQESTIFASMDDLAALGLGDLGVAATQVSWVLEPNNRTARNNFAYARFLAGHSAAELKPLLQEVEFGSGGQSAHATLDTLAAVSFALGRRAEALDLVRRALLASVVPNDDEVARQNLPKKLDFAKTYGILASSGALPLVRLATFLNADGSTTAARLAAAQVLLDPGDPLTAMRARQIIGQSQRSKAAIPQHSPHD